MTAPADRQRQAGDGFGALLPPGAIRAVFQPIVRLSDLEPIGYEGLSPLPHAAGVPPAERLLFVNVSPHLIGHPGLDELAARLPSRLVVELTEQDAVSDVMALSERLRPWIARADAALYRVKRGGRDGVALAPPA